MNYIIKHGETGIFYTYPFFPPTQKISILQEQLKLDTKIDIKDQQLFTKKGQLLKSEDTFAIFEQENCFQTTLYNDIEQQENKQQQYNVIYLFNQKLMNVDEKQQQEVKDRLLAEFLDKSNKNISSYIQQKAADMEFNESIGNQINDQQKDFLMSINRDLLQIEAKKFDAFFSVKNLFLNYEVKQKYLEKFVVECDNQLQSFDVIIKFITALYYVGKQKKVDINKLMKENIDKNSIIVKDFEDSIKKLANIELHEQLKTSKWKVLLDIYYSREAMENFKKNCVTKYKNLKHSYEQFLDSHKGTLQQIFITIAQDYKTLRKNIQSILENNDNKLALTYLQSVQISQLTESQKQIEIFNENLESITKIFQQFLFSKLSNEKTVISIHKIMNKLGNDIHLINTKKSASLNTDISKLEKDFTYLLNPSKLPNAYNQAIKEVSRRNEFNEYYTSKLSKINSLFKMEYEKRKRFLQQYGKILPTEFIPQLRNFPPTVQILDEKNDMEYPLINNLHDLSDSYKQTKKCDSNSSEKLENLQQLNEAYSNQIQWLQQEINDWKLKANKSSNSNNSNSSAFCENQKERIVQLQEEVESLNELVVKTHDYYREKKNKIGVDKENCSSKESYQLTMKIKNLTELLQDTSKSQFNIYARKLQEQKTLRDRLSDQLLQKQDHYEKSKNELNIYYEDRINKLIKEKNLLQKKLNEQLEIQTQVEEVNQQERENVKVVNKQLEEARQQISALEIRAKQFNESKNSQLREINELKDKFVKFEQKSKLEHSDVISNIHNINKQEQQKYISKINSQELDLVNRQQTIDKLTVQLKTKEKDNNDLQTNLSKLRSQLDEQLQQLSIQKDQISQFKTKLENSKLITDQKNQEVTDLTKQKTQLESQNSQLFQQIQEYTTKLATKDQTLQSHIQTITEQQFQLTSLKQKLDAYQIERQNNELSNQSNEEREARIQALEMDIQIKQIDFQQKVREGERVQQLLEENLVKQESLNKEIDELKKVNQEQKSKIIEILETVSQQTEQKEQEQQENSQLKQTLQQLQQQSQIQSQQQKDEIELIQLEKEKQQLEQIELKKQIKDLEDGQKEQERSYQEQIRKLKVDQDSYKENIEELERKNTELIKIKSDYDQLRLENNQNQIILNQKILEISELQENSYNNKAMTLKNENQEIVDEKISELQNQINQQKTDLEAATQKQQEYEALIDNLQEELKQQQEHPTEDAFELTSQNLDQLMANPPTDTTLYIKNLNFKGLGKLNYFEFLNFQSQLCETEKVSLNSLNIGERLLFIPFSEGIYVPFLFMENQQKEFNQFQSINSQSKFNYLLDYQNLTEKDKSLLNECTLLVVAKISKIQQKSKLTQEEQIKYKLSGNEEVILIQIETPQYMVGFEEDNYRLIKY